MTTALRDGDDDGAERGARPSARLIELAPFAVSTIVNAVVEGLANSLLRVGVSASVWIW